MTENPSPGQRDTISFLGITFSYTTLLLLVLAFTFLAYSNVTGSEFVYDDWLQIVRNPQLESWKNIPHFFMGDVWGFAVNSQQGSYYRPVFTLWLLLNFKAFGVNPHWWHLTTLLLHVLMTFLVYLLARRLLRSQPAGLMAALFFGLTPLHLESVAWVIDGIDTLMGVFFVGAFLLLLRARERSWTRSISSLFLYALALLVKETAIVLPGIVCLYGWSGMEPSPTIPSSRQRWWSAVRLTWPYAVVTGLYFMARRFALHAMASPQQHQPVWMILKTVPAVLWFYLQHLLWPFRTSEFYGLQFVKTAGLMNCALPAVAVIAAAAALYFWGRKSPLVTFCGWWILLPLLPALVGLALYDENDLVHDRHLYLSSVAFCILLAFAFSHIGKAKLRIAAFVLLAGLLGVSTAEQSRYWANDFHLYSRGVQVAPRNPLPRNYLAYVYVQKGDYKRGLELYHQALELDPQSWRTNINLATTYFEAGELVAAERFYEQAIVLYPKNANQRNSSQYYYLGLTRLRMRHIADAEQPFRNALEINPSGSGYHYALGYVLFQQGKLQEARQQFQADLNLNPDSPAKHDLALIDARLTSR